MLSAKNAMLAFMLLAFDLDKTIVRNDYELPTPIIEAIDRAKEGGHLVTVLTGRPKVAAEPYLDSLGINDYYSTNHGSLVTGKNDAILRQTHIDKAHVADLLKDYLEHPDVEFSCVVGDTLYVKDPADERWSWAHTLNRKLSKFHPELELHADKIVFTANGLSPKIRNYVSETYPDFVMYPWEEGYLEITGPNADKGSALELLAGELGVEQKDIIAFGDGPNDTSMLTYAGHGISVGPHAHPDTVAAANEHIVSPEDLGVAKWLEENLL